MAKVVRLSVVALAALAAVGCTSPRLVDGVSPAADHYGVRDASTLCVAGRGYLRFDAGLRSDLDDVLALSDLSALQAGGTDVLTRAHALAAKAADAEIDRLPPSGLAVLLRGHEAELVPEDPAEARASLKRDFAAQAQAAAEADIADLKSAGNATAAKTLLRRIRGGIEQPVGERGKLSRVMLTAPLFLPASLGAEMADAEAARRALTANFEQSVLYRPANAAAARSPEELDCATDEQLAEWFAPVFVQQTVPTAAYAPTEDRWGRIELSGTPEQIEVHVDVSVPVLYWTRGTAKIGAQRYDQLIYVAWYPSRPALESGDAFAGHIDGVVVRITLDRRHRPAVYEFVRSCGCFHTLWVAEFVEAAARRALGPPAAGKGFAVQKPMLGRALFFPQLVPDDGARPRRPQVFVNAGEHLMMGVKPDDGTALATTVVADLTYRLQPYAALTALPLGDGVASMFGSDGLVHDAGRKEGWLLAPTGMLSAGQPRQLGTMKIRMDAYDYDDPRLLERHLRFPPGF